MENLEYQSILSLVDDDLIRREVCNDVNSFAEKIARVFYSLFRRRPRQAVKDSTGLQGNICEFCVWELGDEHWQLYKKQFSWPANACKPWQPNSDSGVDIIAIDDNADNVYIIEVKSTKSGGSEFIDGDNSSLKLDFKHLFEKPQTAPENRIWGSVNEASFRLSIDNCYELADKVVASVGDNAETCHGVRLVGVLVCKKGQNVRSHNARKEHFFALRDWLEGEGWQRHQLEFRTIELEDFKIWYSSILQRITEP